MGNKEDVFSCLFQEFPTVEEALSVKIEEYFHFFKNASRLMARRKMNSCFSQKIPARWHRGERDIIFCYVSNAPR